VDIFFELLAKSAEAIQFVWEKRDMDVRDFLDLNDETNTDIDMVI
jgi:hypothetical protein